MLNGPYQTITISPHASPSYFRRRYLTIPDGFAPEGSNLIITGGPGRCLLLFREKAWAPLRDKLVKLTGDNPRESALKRVVLGNARTETLGKRGRLEVADELCEFSHLGKTALWVPVANHVEVWNPGVFRENKCRSWLP